MSSFPYNFFAVLDAIVRSMYELVRRHSHQHVIGVDVGREWVAFVVRYQVPVGEIPRMGLQARETFVREGLGTLYGEVHNVIA
jgi:hypothetical protein